MIAFHKNQPSCFVVPSSAGAISELDYWIPVCIGFVIVGLWLIAGMIASLRICFGGGRGSCLAADEEGPSEGFIDNKNGSGISQCVPNNKQQVLCSACQRRCFCQPMVSSDWHQHANTLPTPASRVREPPVRPTAVQPHLHYASSREWCLSSYANDPSELEALTGQEEATNRSAYATETSIAATIDAARRTSIRNPDRVSFADIAIASAARQTCHVSPECYGSKSCVNPYRHGIYAEFTFSGAVSNFRPSREDDLLAVNHSPSYAQRKSDFRSLPNRKGNVTFKLDTFDRSTQDYANTGQSGHVENPQQNDLSTAASSHNFIPSSVHKSWVPLGFDNLPSTLSTDASSAHAAKPPPPDIPADRTPHFNFPVNEQ